MRSLPLFFLLGQSLIHPHLPIEAPGQFLVEGSGQGAPLPVAAQGGGGIHPGLGLRSLFSLRSATFTVTWDGAQFLFDVTGYGHGVGMSQYGANAMAKSGSSFADILTWYYTGTQVGDLW